MQKMITSHSNSISMPCLDTFNGVQDYSFTVHTGSLTTKPCIKKKTTTLRNTEIYTVNINQF
jgi:hypothetical protein